MNKLFLKILLSLTISISTLYKSQKIDVQGIAKDSLGTVGIAISVNDTIRKFRDKAFKDKNWDGYDKLVNDKNFFTYPDSVGNYRITANLTDTLYFYKRKYITQKYKVSDIIKKNIKVNLVKMPCIPNKKCNQEVPSKLYIFVGHKIDVASVDTSKYCGEMMDSEYKAEYKIEQEFSDHYADSAIVFTAYDHNSRHEYDFRNYENVLIFVGEYCGELIQLKYQFFPVYKTVDGRWASPVDTFMENYYKSDHFSPIQINFEKSVSFNLPINITEEQIRQLKQNKYPEKYYKFTNGRVFPIMGRYSQDLVKLWKEVYEKNKE